MNKKLLDIYTDYFISQNHSATATGLSKLLDGDINHDQITRFFHSKKLTGFLLLTIPLKRNLIPMKVMLYAGTTLMQKEPMLKESIFFLG